MSNELQKLPNLAKAIISVMKDVKGIDKSMTIGTGTNSYKGVPDQEVKKVIGEAMAKAGLCILPIDVAAITKMDRWEESTQYGVKQKQSVFTEATTKYMLMHESGECIEVAGYGHGIDTQDKGAGKATTYALKYTLLYLFMVPTGKIDDSDNIHSDDTVVPIENNNDRLWKEAINNCTTVEALSALYKQNEKIIKESAPLAALFTKRKAEVKK